MSDLFHSHLDDCGQCRDNPFKLCPVGQSLMARTVEQSREDCAFIHRLTRRWHKPYSVLDKSSVVDLVAERAYCRVQRDFARADEIRDLLQFNGVLLEDFPSGTTLIQTVEDLRR